MQAVGLASVALVAVVAFLTAAKTVVDTCAVDKQDLITVKAPQTDPLQAAYLDRTLRRPHVVDTWAVMIPVVALTT